MKTLIFNYVLPYGLVVSSFFNQGTATLVLVGLLFLGAFHLVASSVRLLSYWFKWTALPRPLTVYWLGCLVYFFGLAILIDLNYFEKQPLFLQLFFSCNILLASYYITKVVYGTQQHGISTASQNHRYESRAI